MRHGTTPINNPTGGPGSFPEHQLVEDPRKRRFVPDPRGQAYLRELGALDESSGTKQAASERKLWEVSSEATVLGSLAIVCLTC